MHGFSLRMAVVICLIGIFGFALSPALAQNKSTAASQEKKKADAEHERDADASGVGKDTPVITMDGFCDPTAVIGDREKPCRTVVTRSQFDELAEEAKADELAAKSQLATAYIRFALLAREAQKRGMDKDLEFKRKMELTRNQTLGQMLVWDLQQKAQKFSGDDLRKFFQANPSQFEQANLLRVHIPETRFVTQPNGVQDPIPETAPEMKVLADKTYARVLAGEDFATLQRQVFEAAKVDDDPGVELSKMSRTHLRQSHRHIFDLKPGEVSALLHEPEEGYYIYKMVSKEIPAFESAKGDVASALEKQRMETWLNEIMNSAKSKVSEEYFGPAAAKSINAK